MIAVTTPLTDTAALRWEGDEAGGLRAYSGDVQVAEIVRNQEDVSGLAWLCYVVGRWSPKHVVMRTSCATADEARGRVEAQWQVWLDLRAAGYL